MSFRKLFLKKNQFLFFNTLLFLLLLFVYFVNQNWGQGHFFHPDENNMARALSDLTFKDLNPHFFAYGQFPLYLSFFTGQILNFLFGISIKPETALSFSTSVYLLRFYSALATVFLVFISQKIYHNLFPKHSPYLVFLFSILTPGLIQIAHFGTTEALLSLTFLLNIYLSILFLKSKKPFPLIFLTSLITSIGLATKLTAFFFLIPPFLSLFFLFLSSKKKGKIIFLTLTYLSLSLLLFVFFSPYNFLSLPDFFSSMKYEISVAQGTLDVFYTRQFKNTIPYFFQFQKIYPFVLGVPFFLLSLLSLPILLFSSFKAPSLYRKKITIILLPVLIFFLYNAQLYTKWTRFLAPTFFIFPFLSSYFVLSLNQFLKRKNQNFLSLFLPLFLTILSVFPGFMFLRTYLSTDSRVQANNWLVKNVSPQSKIFSEAGNVINFPLTPADFSVNNFDFYELNQQENPALLLAQALYDSDYIIIPSRRVYANYSTSQYPVVQKYYQQLFSQNLGFKPEKTFSNFPRVDFLGLKINDELAEETWSVFDHPVIRIYKKEKPRELSDYYLLLTSP